MTTPGYRTKFDEWAPEYENDRVSRFIARFQHLAFTTLDPRPGELMADVGCGSGAAVRAAAHAGARALGIEPSAGMVTRAVELAADRSGISFVRGLSGALPLRDGTCDAVLCSTSLHHHRDQGASLADMARVLRPGGRLVVVDFCRDMPWMWLFDRVERRTDPEHVGFVLSRELRDWAAAAGLTDVTVGRRWGGMLVLLGARRPAQP